MCAQFCQHYFLKRLLSPLHDLGTFVKSKLAIYTWINFWVLQTVPLVYIPGFIQYYPVLLFIVLYYSLKWGIVLPPVFFSKFPWIGSLLSQSYKIALGILEFLHFHLNFRLLLIILWSHWYVVLWGMHRFYRPLWAVWLVKQYCVCILYNFFHQYFIFSIVQIFLLLGKFVAK